MTPQYNTKLFTEIWDNYEDFKSELDASPFGTAITDDSKELAFYLLYARYGNNPIANMDENQWRFKVFSVIFQYGPTWEKKLDIQKKLRELTDNELATGDTTITNAADNPNTVPSTQALDELTYINAQRVNKEKRSKLSSYGILLQLLENDVTEEFIRRFEHLFKAFVLSENPLLYITETEGE